MNSKRRSLPTRRAPTLPAETEDSLIKRARRLPLSGPGIVTTIPLSLLPAYYELHHLEPIGAKPGCIVVVRRIKPEATK